MEYGKPQKLPDGRYFLRISGATHQVNGLVLQDALSAKSVNFKVPESLLNIFGTIDENLVAKAKESKVEWFGKELSDETINSAFQESVTDGILGASLASTKGQVTTTVFDTQKNRLEVQDVKAETTCDVVFELAGLWFLKKSFGPVWRVVQVRVRGAPKPPTAPKEYMFTDDPEEDESEDPSDFLD